MAKDYYGILGLDKSASEEEIKKAYKKLAKKYHPDISKEADAEQKFKDVNEAANVLLDKQKKSNYDNYGSAEGPGGFSGGSGFGGGGFNPEDFGMNMEDIFEQFGFGGFGGGSGFNRRGPRKPRKEVDIYEELEITLEDVYFGTEKNIPITRDIKCETCEGRGAKSQSDIKTCGTCNGSGVIIETQRSILGAIKTQRLCPTCDGSGEVISNPCETCNGKGANKKRENVSIKVPKGVESGITLRVSGKGDYDKDTKRYGDLYLKVYVKRHSDYEVEGNDLHKTVKINFVQAIIGDEIDIKHFDKTLTIKIPEGTQPSTVLRVKDKGLPQFNSEHKGDLYVKVDVEIPKKTTNKQKEILIEYAKTLKDKNLIDRIRGFFR